MLREGDGRGIVGRLGGEGGLEEEKMKRNGKQGVMLARGKPEERGAEKRQSERGRIRKGDESASSGMNEHVRVIHRDICFTISSATAHGIDTGFFSRNTGFFSKPLTLIKKTKTLNPKA